MHQLEQAVSFERAARYAEIMENNPSAQQSYKKAKEKFVKLAHQVDEEILAAEARVAEIIQHEKDIGGPVYIIEEFEHVEKILKKIELAHKEFDEHVFQVFKLFEAGRIYEAERLATQVEKEEDKLDHELEALLLELEEFMAEAALKAEHLEVRLLKILAISCTIFTAIFLLTAYTIVRSIINPLIATKNYADELSRENLDVEQPKHNFEDEIADMMSSLSVFKENAIEARELREQQKEREIQAEKDKRQMMLDMASNFDSQVGGLISSLASASTEMQSTAEAMRNIADETSQSSATVAASTEEASTNVGTVASAMEEMSASASEIASQITSAKHKSNDTASNAQNANETVGNLNSLVTNIGEVVIAIKDIAEQTNLLALNATIEAARAGEAGKGFAVVADEVKKLANETAQKTDEIESRITEIQGATQDSVQAMERIISNISEIDGSVTSVSAAVEEQNVTTNEIVRSVSEASQGVQQVAQIIVDVQKGAGETGTSADAVLGAAKEVAELSENLKGQVDQFLDTIRTDNANQNMAPPEEEGQAAE